MTQKRHIFLLEKHEPDGSDKTEKSCEMVPMELFALEHHTCNSRKDSKGNHLLDYLKLNEGEGSAIADETNLVGRYLKRILKESNCPRKDDYSDERPAVADVHLLQFQVAVPCESHEYVTADKQHHSIYSVHILIF